MGNPVLEPKIGINLIAAGIVDAFDDRRDLIVGLAATNGTAVTADTLFQNVHNYTKDQLTVQFGTGETYHRIQTWRSANGNLSPLDVLILDQTAPTAPVGSIQVTGAPTADGTFTVIVLDERQFSVSVSVTNGDTVDDVAAAIDTALNTLSSKAFSNVQATDTVTVTSLDASTFGELNNIGVVSDIAGLTFTITQFTGGANGVTPAAGSFDPLNGIRYTGINWPQYFESQLGVLNTFLAGRFNPTNGITDGVGFAGTNKDTSTAAIALATLNSPVLCIGAGKSVSSRPTINQPADWIMCYFQGVRARRLTPDAPISDFVIATGGALDGSGGPALASLPYFNTPLALTPVTPATNQWTFTEQGELEDGGVAYWGVNSAGTSMIMGPVTTTSTTDSGGNDNDSFHYLNYVDTASVCREIFYNTLKATYAQSRLTEGDLIPQRSMANAESIKAEVLRIYKVLSRQALVQAGRTAESFFSTNTTVTVSLATRSATIAGPLPIVTQLGTITYNLQLAFTVGDAGANITF
jgi:phage tail sheath gpL-like